MLPKNTKGQDIELKQKRFIKSRTLKFRYLQTFESGQFRLQINIL